MFIDNSAPKRTGMAIEELSKTLDEDCFVRECLHTGLWSGDLFKSDCSIQTPQPGNPMRLDKYVRTNAWAFDSTDCVIERLSDTKIIPVTREIRAFSKIPTGLNIKQVITFDFFFYNHFCMNLNKPNGIYMSSPATMYFFIDSDTGLVERIVQNWDHSFLKTALVSSTRRKGDLDKVKRRTAAKWFDKSGAPLPQSMEDQAPLLQKAEEPKVEELKAEEPLLQNTEEPKAEETKVVETKPEEPKAEPKAEESKAEEPEAEEPKSKEPKAEEPKSEEPKAEELKAEEPKAEVEMNGDAKKIQQGENTEEGEKIEEPEKVEEAKEADALLNDDHDDAPDPDV